MLRSWPEVLRLNRSVLTVHVDVGHGRIQAWPSESGPSVAASTVTMVSTGLTNWGDALAKIRQSFGDRRVRFQVTVDPSVAPVLSLFSATTLGAAQWKKFAEHRFGLLLGSQQGAYEIVLEEYVDKTRLAWAIPRGLSAGVAALGAHANVTETSMQPLLAAGWSLLPSRLVPRGAFWLVVANVSTMHAAWVTPDGWNATVPSLRDQSSISDLIARESLLLGLPQRVNSPVVVVDLATGEGEGGLHIQPAWACFRPFVSDVSLNNLQRKSAA